MKNAISALCGLVLWLTTQLAQADEVLVAVAANFTAPMQAIAAEFERDTGHRAQLAFAASGKFYAQITQGAPFELFLSADDQKTAQLEADGRIEPGSRFTYAIGALVLWSSRPGLADGQASLLRSGEFKRLAIANPKLAPYGMAAIETLTALGILEQVRPKLIYGESIGQAFQFVASGNAELGLVAASQLQVPGQTMAGSFWPVPARLHAPIRQEAVLLQRGSANPAARALWAYLSQAKARAIILAHGYRLESSHGAD